MSKMSARIRAIKRERVQNARNERASGAGSPYDYGTGNAPSMLSVSSTAQDQIALALYKTDWAARKIVNIPTDDMLREGWTITGLAEADLKKVENAQDVFALLETFRQAMRVQDLLGGSAIFMGVDDGQSDPAVPLDYGNTRRDALKFLNVVPRNRITRTEFDDNPLTPNYGRPEFYTINGFRVHRSRLILFKGDPLLDVPDSTLGISGIGTRMDGFGDSKLMAILDDLTRATGSRQAAFQLVQRAGVFFAQYDGGDLDGGTAMDVLRDIVNQVNVFRGAVFSSTPGQTFPPISTISPSFGSVPELMMSFLQVLSAASDIPATRFLGQAPGGLNATGESDLENYYGRLESAQRQKLRPQLFQLMQVLIPSVTGKKLDTEAVDITFPPLWSMSEKEEAEVRKTNVDSVVALASAGIATTEEAAESLNALEIFPVEFSGEGVPLPDPAGLDDEGKPLADSLEEMTGAGDPAEEE